MQTRWWFLVYSVSLARIFKKKRSVVFSVAIYALEAAVAEGERACPGTQARLNPQPRILRRAGLPSFSSPAGAAGGRRPPGGAPPAAPRGGPGWGEAEAAV